MMLFARQAAESIFDNCERLLRLWVLIAPLVSASLSPGFTYAASALDDSAFETFKRQIREQSKENPAEGEQVIAGLEADRKAAKRFREHPEELEHELTSLVEPMRRTNTPTTLNEFADAREAFQSKLEWCFQNEVPVPLKAANKIAHDVLDIFEARQSFSALPDALPITVAARYARSPRTKSYLLRVINGPSDELKRHALTELAWSRSLKGDKEIFEGLAKLRENDEENSGAILGAMSRLDRKRALPILLHEISTTKNIRRFTQDSDILSEYGRAELLEHVLIRIKDFPRRGLADPKNPTIGIYPELLLKYIESVEGQKLELGLSALEQSVEALAKCGPTLRKKLQSSHVSSRRVAAKFILRMERVPALHSSEFLEGIETLSGNEEDESARQTLREILSQARVKKRIEK